MVFKMEEKIIFRGTPVEIRMFDGITYIGLTLGRFCGIYISKKQDGG